MAAAVAPIPAEIEALQRGAVRHPATERTSALNGFFPAEPVVSVEQARAATTGALMARAGGVMQGGIGQATSLTLGPVRPRKAQAPVPPKAIKQAHPAHAI